MTTDTSTTGQQKYYFAIAAVVVVLLLALWFLFKPDAKVIEPEQPIATETAPPVITAPVETVTTPESEFTTDLPAEPEDVVEVVETPLPTLDESDPEIKQTLLNLDWQPGLASLIVTDQMVRNFVVQVDNIAHGQLVKGHNVLQPIDQRFIGGKNPPYQLEDANFSRYEPYVALLESISAAEMLVTLQRFEPLAEQAFKELGYPDDSFKQRVVSAIDVLLQTPEVDYPITLDRPSVMYKFADARLEALPAPQKMMLRMGPENQKRLKAVLRQYRTELQQ
ncbi:DUF3014 domain-containing protein [Rheinheimera salexigens]|uniref:DUF3014 domain-containing protein n=1 Tax=Rheinheimera salexigens TaxID=1628148 RepID=A0A1E7Q8Q6_9GAMM|nr:DUF3014 domain-containing protein [Rheinheimera salexigens]OEY70559.1 hypothetical protein BI198_14045 [Rheinheimera salexigens]